MKNLPWITGALGLAALAAFASPGLTDAWQYDRQALGEGEVWRLVTGHLTHWDGEHLGWDLLALALLGGLCERRGRRRLLLCAALAVLVISAGLWVFLPEMNLYRGLSGLDSALFALLATSMLLRARGPAPALVAGGALALLLAKMSYELAFGSALFVQSASFVPVPLAHLLGAVAGLAAGLWPSVSGQGGSRIGGLEPILLRVRLSSPVRSAETLRRA